VPHSFTSVPVTCDITGGVLTANHAAVYQAAGYLKVAGGAPPTWIAH